MTGIRKFQYSDIAEIGDVLVEPAKCWDSVSIVLACMKSIPGISYTYVKEDKVVACCGSVKDGEDWDVWAMYSDEFSFFTRAKAAVSFRKKFHSMWKADNLKSGSKARYSVPQDVPNSMKYGEFMGGVFVGTEQSKVFEGVVNNIFKVI